MQATGLTGSEGPQDGDWERCHPEASSPLQVEAVYVSESDWYLPDPPEPECGTSRGKTPMVLVQRLPSSVVRRYINESNAHIFASTAFGSAPASYDEQTIQTANGKKTLKRLQEEATQLKLPTKGTKAQLEKRYRYAGSRVHKHIASLASTPKTCTETFH
ncbi:uncharacterized protein LOC110678675 isoform X3 [Aedes aegypti]|uniref:SAP domain-containing protein n=1 Tax=Aedes aegypti TaxID=7159 RepID=A0A6I8T3L2_AEDAE|nr:uncharacterized protein LOC110674045 isoform X2 [Aedes aegypti]XP_021697083.1 uncharacterized protein LOC110675709 isoform X2 [Aedes aegypti]XP_021707124.1 uncharacterized protein LOC5578482 isoform X3 [Aedes aegypti]XP_021707572.1 uncharacterized protein LOC110678675 isoform X3 [Aedes aegypti]